MGTQMGVETEAQASPTRAAIGGGPHCVCGGCSGVQQIYYPFNGQQVPTGIVHHTGRHIFVKLDSVHEPLTSERSHQMNDDELLAHFSAYDEGTFAQSVPRPLALPLVEVPRGDEAARAEVASLMRQSNVGPIESLVTLPHWFCPTGEGVRYGDIALAAYRHNDALHPLFLLVKACLPVVTMCVCVVLNAPGENGNATAPFVGTDSDLNVVGPMDNVLVRDDAVLVVSRGAHWETTQRLEAMREAGTPLLTPEHILFTMGKLDAADLYKLNLAVA